MAKKTPTTFIPATPGKVITRYTRYVMLDKNNNVITSSHQDDEEDKITATTIKDLLEVVAERCLDYAGANYLIEGMKKGSGEVEEGWRVVREDTVQTELGTAEKKEFERVCKELADEADDTAYNGEID